ncbi:hypothetical protein AB5J62_33640 [Amycolatopsis sp. cg5]|uniref:hypothetical protein n=1 Tax=Amycolatopsis sp. cg5 TaxID=3238802 RepID=UPI0035268D62
MSYQAHDNGFMWAAIETDGYGNLQLSCPDSKVIATIEYDHEQPFADNVANLVRAYEASEGPVQVEAQASNTGR